jgi:hypothetical protein
VAGRQFGDAREQRGRIARRLAVDLDHDVLRVDAGTIRRSAAHDAANGDAALGRPRSIARLIHGLDAEPAARHLAILDDLLQHVAGDRYRDREADADRAAGLREDHAVDADQVAGRIDERAAGVPEIDRSIGLDEVLEAVYAEVVAPECADDSGRHRVAKAERIAYREHGVADAHAVDCAERDRREIVPVCLQHSDVGFGIGAADMRRDPSPVVKHELDVVGPLDDVIIGQDEAVG